jgi:hypothetical protein
VDLELIRDVYELHNSLGTGFPAVLERDLLHPEAEFVEAAAVPGAATHSGREAVAALFRERLDAGQLRIDELELTVLDERTALVAFRAHMRGTGGGAEAAMRLWNIVTVEGSRIARVEEFTDEPSARAAAAQRSRS